jgi:hypothetical protein
LRGTIICVLLSKEDVMSNCLLMEQVLHDLLPDLMALHAATKSERLKLRIKQYVERIVDARYE